MYKLHAVVVKKPVELKEAKKIGADIIKDKSKTFYRETPESYRFRNIAKTKFDPSTFRSKKVNPQTTLIFGKTKFV